MTSRRAEGCNLIVGLTRNMGGGSWHSQEPSASELCDLWVFHVTPPMRNAFFNLNQVVECHFQTDFTGKPGPSRVRFPGPDVWGVFITRQGEVDSCRCRADSAAGFAGLHKGDIHCLCLIRASRTGWDSLLFDGEHGYEDGQSLCSLSETIV